MAKGSSKAVGSAYASYKLMGRQKANRTRKLTKQLKLQPNNEQVRLALLNVGYRRKTPNTRQWTSVSKEYAQLVGSITPNHAKTVTKGMFSIETRVKTNV